MTAALDFSYARPSAAEILDAGASHALAYTGSGKPRPTRDYLDSLLEAGVSFTFIQESYANRAQEGYAAGVADAHYADAQADGVGYPEDAAIAYCASDGNRTSPGAGAAPAISEYGRGVADTSRRPLLAYGNRVAVDAFRAGAGPRCVGTWVPATWNALPGTDVLVQEPNIASPVPETDWNTCYGDWPRWGGGGDEDLNDDQNKWLQAIYQRVGGDGAYGRLGVLDESIGGVAVQGIISNLTLLDEIGKVLAKLDTAGGAGGGGLSEAQVRAIVREELDHTKLGH